MMEKEKIVKHESFGLISACRTNGSHGHFFYGSDMQPNNFITITLCKNCQIEYDNVMGKRYTEGRNNLDDIVEIEMTSTQFAEFITTLNVGQGVPCNIKKFGRVIDRYEENEELDSKYEYEYKKSIEILKKQRGAYNEAHKKIMEICDKLPNKKKEEISSIINKLATDVCDNVPFHIRNIKDASEEIVSKAKTEIASYLNVATNIVTGKQLDMGEKPLQLDVVDMKDIEEIED